MIIQAVENAQEILRKIGEGHNSRIDESFVKKVEGHLKEQVEIQDVIATTAAEKSIALNNYFMLHKKYLAGYAKEQDDFTNDNINLVVAKKILLCPGTTVKCQDIARCCRFPADVIKSTMNDLASMNLGRVNFEKPHGGGRVAVVFLKLDASQVDLEGAIEIGEKLNRFGIRLDDYKNQMENSENILCPSKKQKTQ